MAVTQCLPGYTSPGARNKHVGVAEVVGPNPYVPGTGIPITARQFGIGGFDMVAASGFSLTRTYFLGPTRYPVAAAGANQGAVQSVNFLVYLTAGGAEAGAIDLSAEVFKIVFFGV